MTSAVAIVLFGFASFLVPTADAQVCKSCEPGQFGTVTCCASSVLPAQGGRSDGPSRAAGNPATAGVEGVSGNGLGQWIEQRRRDAACFRTIVLHNGYGRNRSIFLANNRIRDAVLTASDGLSISVTLPDNNREYRIRLPRIVKSRWLRLTIHSVYRGAR